MILEALILATGLVVSAAFIEAGMIRIADAIRGQRPETCSHGVALTSPCGYCHAENDQ